VRWFDDLMKDAQARPPSPSPDDARANVARGRVPIFCNARSGRASPERQLRDALEAARVAFDLRTVPPGALARAIEGAVADGARIIGVAGGDGSISTAAQVLVGTPTVLAVFPAGTMNHFARALGIGDHETAARALARRAVASIDVGDVNGRVFVNGVSFGVYPRTLRLRQRWEPRIGKWPAALLAAARAVIEYPGSPGWRSRASGAGRRYPLVYVGAGRGSFRNPRMNPRELNSGVLEVVALATHSRIELVRMAGRILRRGFDGLVACAETRSCTIEYTAAFSTVEDLPPTVRAGWDGELVRLQTPLHFRVRPGALRVITDRAAG